MIKIQCFLKNFLGLAPQSKKLTTRLQTFPTTPLTTRVVTLFSTKICGQSLIHCSYMDNFFGCVAQELETLSY